jgi:hypothetical protein
MSVSKAQQIAFLNMIAPIAREQARKHDNKIFASVCIAQAIHESGWGTAPKMVNANALFGIKVGKAAYKFGTAWKGAAYKTGTTEYYDGVNPTKIVDYFRKYDSVEDSTEDYFDMLCHSQRYKSALNRKTPAECINAIVAGGYATGPAYASAIMKLINGYNLTAYDGGTAPAASLSPYQIGKTYTLQNDMYVRQTPNGSKVKFDSLTEDGKKNGKYDDEGNAILKKGTRVTCRGMSENWMQIPSGWVCAYNSSKTYII